MFWFGDFKSVVDDGEVAFNEFSMQMKDELERIEFSLIKRLLRSELEIAVGWIFNWCEATFSSFLLAWRIIKERLLGEGEAYRCDHCGIDFKARISLKTHMSK